MLIVEACDWQVIMDDMWLWLTGDQGWHVIMIDTWSRMTCCYDWQVIKDDMWLWLTGDQGWHVAESTAVFPRPRYTDGRERPGRVRSRLTFPCVLFTALFILDIIFLVNWWNTTARVRTEPSKPSNVLEFVFSVQVPSIVLEFNSMFSNVLETKCLENAVILAVYWRKELNKFAHPTTSG